MVPKAPTPNRPPYSILQTADLTQTPTDTTIFATLTSFTFLATKVATLRTFNFFLIAQPRTLRIKRDGHWLLN